MEHKALIAGLITFIFLFYGIFLFFMVGRWRGKRGTKECGGWINLDK